MLDFLRRNKIFLGAYAALLLLMLLAVFTQPKGTLHLWLNSAHTPAQDAIWRLYTRLAEWPIYVLMLGLLFYRYSAVVYYVVAEVSATLITQLIKLLVNAPRPLQFFGDNADFQQIIVAGTHLHRWHSFPSGHAQTFFVCATVLALLFADAMAAKPRPKSSNPRPKSSDPRPLRRPQRCRQVWLTLVPLMLVCFAASGAWSRVYLSFHFLNDVLVGSLIGVAAALASWPLYRTLSNKWAERRLALPKTSIS